MKSFTQFLGEAESQAASQARKLNLKSDGHGGWIDSRGKFVAKTEKGKLKFYNQRKPAAAEGPVQQMAKRRADDDLAGAPLQKPAPKVQKTAPKDAESDETGEKDPSEALTVAFGRFNPPTAGHEKLLQQAKKTAAGGDLKIYPSRSHDSKKNPLDPDMKVSYMRKMFPDFEEQIVNDAEMISIFNVLTTASEEGYKNVNIIVGADRQAEFENLATKYNGDLYDFEEIRVISAGPRDADAAGVEGMSSSKQRKAVLDDDYDTFKTGLPKGMSNADGQALFDAVRSGMKVKKSVKKESYQLWEIAPRFDQKGLRDNYVQEKIYKLGDIVESLSTGLVGTIVRRGTNHLICVTENDFMFKSWIRDITEKKKYGDDSIYRAPGKPNTLVGTSGYLKYAMKMTDTKKIKNFNIKEFINKYKKK
tara:strand:+ start:271 stop:1527 length:1257 start_codon:yes stop_codon:yes gene_type:complete